MAVPGLLVEYLISGALALVWLAPLLKRVELDVTQASVLPLLVLWLYVVGMVVDFLAFWLVKPIKPMVRRRALKKLGLPDPPTEGANERSVDFALHAPELAREMAMRSSRDRIARGAVVNAIVAVVLERVVSINPPTLPLSLWVAVILGLMLIWAVFENLSYRFELRATQALDRKLGQGLK